MSLRYDALNIVLAYLHANTTEKYLSQIDKELCEMCLDSSDSFHMDFLQSKTYDETQNILSVLNEKESIRKTKGVYYTPCDVVAFIAKNCVRLAYEKILNNLIELGDESAAVILDEYRLH